MDLEGHQTPHPVRNAAVNVGAAYAGYKAGDALARRRARRERRAMDSGVKAFLITTVVLSALACVVWVAVLGYQGFNATR